MGLAQPVAHYKMLILVSSRESHSESDNEIRSFVSSVASFAAFLGSLEKCKIRKKRANERRTIRMFVISCRSREPKIERIRESGW